ncbi:amidase family protein [Sphingomonas flavalba]|uniref:amidase family protein n=1 Tax=Sphingomonas flavalba TaxID=2559804 RepID=UPI00109E2BFF|nr:amidase family protein [Sphingomonas flavalba]
MTAGGAAAALGARIERAAALNAIAEVDTAALVREGAPSADGAPFVHVKDNIAVRGLQWTAGTPLFAGVRARRDAAAVRLLREAGASFPLKTTLHELAFGVTGANGWTGAIANPHAPGRVAGGSSGGGAAALAVGLGDLALVTDTGGSARIPAAFCGVIGFRPSTGRYPADGMIALTPSRDTIGLMAHDLRRIVRADAILAGETAALEPRDRPVRIGIATEAVLGPMEPDVTDAYRRCVALVVAAGHSVVPVDLAPILAIDESCGFAIALHETQASLRASTPALTGRPFEDLLAAVATPDVAHLLALAAGGEAVTAARYADAIGREWPGLRRAYAALFADEIDALLLPTTPVTAPLIGGGDSIALNGEQAPTFPTLTRFTRADSMAGLPSISLPFGRDDRGLPIGMMLSAARHADAMLLALAGDLMALDGFPAAG